MRDRFPKRRILLTSLSTIDTAILAIKSAPVDGGVEVIIQEATKARNRDQNALYWAGPLKDMAEQAFVRGRTYSQEVWHIWFKIEFLPDETSLDFDPELVINPETYKKWDYDPKGNPVLIASTTDLSKKGFSLYLEQIYAYGASLGVMFHDPRQPI